jgi:hypothetical protein
MPGDPHNGSKVWKAPDRAISESEKYRRQVVANGDSHPSAASTIDRIAATLGPACGLPMWIQFLRPNIEDAYQRETTHRENCARRAAP